MDIDCTGAESPDILKVADIGTDLLPCDRCKLPVREILFRPLDIGCHVRGIGCDRTDGKVTEGKDILMFFEKDRIGFIHGVSPPIKNAVNSYRNFYRAGCAGT